jgi:membrane protein YqaA with SNARE-associated domain
MMIDPSFFIGIVHSFGYFGVFIASFIGSAATFIPFPSFLIVVAAGSILNPISVGIVAGIGAALGELIGYGLGLTILYGNKKFRKKDKRNKSQKRWNNILQKWFHKRLGFMIVFIFAVTPLPDKIIGIFCGAIKYDIKKFILASVLGKIVLHVALAFIGFYGLGFVGSFF